MGTLQQLWIPQCHGQKMTDTGSTMLSLIKCSPLYLPLHNISAYGSSLSSEVISEDEPHFKTAPQAKISFQFGYAF